MPPIPVLLLASLLLASPLPASAQVNVHFDLSTPPPIVFDRPPELIVIPETYVYAVPGASVEIFFFDGWWWRSWERRWYRSRSYGGGWVHYGSVPVFYRDIPREWRKFYRDRRWRDSSWNSRPIPYREVERNWQNWEQRSYWEKQRHWDIRKEYRQPQPRNMRYERHDYHGPPPHPLDSGKKKQPKNVKEQRKYKMYD